ncbi:MAG TPA: hypothetical protein VI698_06345 [Nitrososphaerales archaeon]|nr:hypothetical protein [Nitrososphaerales archaeon]
MSDKKPKRILGDVKNVSLEGFLHELERPDIILTNEIALLPEKLNNNGYYNLEQYKKYATINHPHTAHITHDLRMFRGRKVRVTIEELEEK